MVDEETGPDAAPEVGDAAPDASMEVAADAAPEEPAQPEVGTAVEPEADDEESTPAKDQANYVPPPPLDQAGYVQGLMVSSSNAGQDQRRESLARNRERRRLQHEAIAHSSQG